MPTTVTNVLAKSVSGATGHTAGHTTYVGNRPQPQTRSILPVNVGESERWVSLAGGALLAGYGLTCRGLTGVLLPVLGGALAFRGLTGNCSAYHALGINTNEKSDRAGVAAGHGVKIEEAVRINRPAAELFAFWRQFSQLPRFMNHLKSVTVTDARHSHWVATGPLGVSVEWDAEVINERPGELIAWQSLPGSDVDTAGAVHFIPAGAQGTEVRVTLKYDPPAGKVGSYVAKVFGEEPGQQVRADLARFKELMEAGTGGAAHVTTGGGL